MKKYTLIVILALFASSARSQITDSMQMSGDAQPQYGDLQLLETWGWLLAENFNLKGLEITEFELEAISRGMNAHIRGEAAPTDLQHSVNQMQEYFTQRETRIQIRQMQEGRAAEQAFFDSLWGQPNIQSLGSGLHFEIIEAGEGPKPTPSDVVVVHYSGTFINGEEFDSSYRKGQPARFKLDGVIPGWTQGLQQIAKGGKIKLYVPSKLGYGDAGSGGVPAASTLIFDVELLDILSGADQPSPPAAPKVSPAQ